MIIMFLGRVMLLMGSYCYFIASGAVIYIDVNLDVWLISCCYVLTIQTATNC